MSKPDLSDCGLQPNLPVLAAVSGGADSLAALHALHQQGYPLVVATFNHGLRPTAADEAAYVREVAAGLGHPFVSGSGDTSGYAAQQGLSIEEAARELRYRFLFSEARKAGAQAVATGHTADDQAETVLMHFLRGAGLSGLKGMPARVTLPIFDPHIPLVRPLLGWTRTDTENYCRGLNLQPCNDLSNTDIHYFRNRLRHELLPILERYNPRIKHALAKTALALQGDYDLLGIVTENAWQNAVTAAGTGYISFQLAGLQEMPHALRRNIFRKAAFLLCPGERDIDFDVLNKAAALAPAELAGGLCTYQEAGVFYLMTQHAVLPSDTWPQAGGNESIVIRSGQTRLASGWVLQCEEVHGENIYLQARSNTDKFTAWLAIDEHEENILVRTVQTGDRFEPLGMPRQTIKLADLFVNLKIPRRLRQQWPLVCQGDAIAWVVGLRLSEQMKITVETQRAYKITVQKNTGQV